MRISKRPIIGVSVLSLVLSGLSVLAPAVAGATGTSLVTESFANSTLSSPSAWSLPTGSSGVCLTAGTNTSAPTIPDCQSSGGDANGSGALQLTNNSGNQVGTVYSNTILPTANGLDISWNSYQFNGTGADGISFDLAAVNPANPTPPATTGPSGGSLGYAALSSPSVPTNGVPYGYLGFGADVYGNYENSAGGFSGTGCANNSSPATAESMGVRGPGDGVVGYCLLGQNNLTGSNLLDNATATSRASAGAVQEEVVLNPSASAITATSSGLSVQAGYWMFATLPIGSGGVWQQVTGVLPTNPTGVPSSWINQSTGLPQELAFGWASSTGGSTEFHQINTLQASTVTAAPVLSITNTDSGSGTIYANSSDTVTLTAGVSASSTVTETQAVTVSDTLPAGLIPTAASGSGWTCTPTGQNVSCTYPAGSIAIGATLPPISVSVTAPSSPTTLTNTASVSSLDGAQANASDSITVLAALLPQTITFTNTPPSPAYVNGTYPVTTDGGGASGNAVVLSVDPSSTSGCTIASGTVTLTAPAGTCVIDANQAGNSSYTAAPQVQQTVTSVLNPQTITFTNTPPVNPQVGATYSVSATGGGSGNPVTFSVDPASTSGCTVGVAGPDAVDMSAPAGTCIIDANQAGDGTVYSAAPQVSQTVTSVMTAQAINFTNTPPVNPQVNSNYLVTTDTGGGSGNAVILSIDPTSTSGCTISGVGVVVLSSPAGTCIVDANQAGNTIYTAAPQVQQTVTSVVIPQSIAFANTPPTNPQVGTTYNVTSNGGTSGGGAIVFSVDPSSTSGCTIASGTVTLSAPAGTCVIDLNQLAVAGTYSAAPQVQQTVTSVQIPQAINFTNTPPTNPQVNSLYTVSTDGGGGSGNTVTLSVDPASTSGCTILSGLVTLSAPNGTCIVDANQAGTPTYSAAPQVQQIVTSVVIPQGITFTNTPPANPQVDSSYTVVATGGGSGNSVAFSIDSSSTSGCFITGTVITLGTPAGTCVVDANQAGIAGTYSPAPQVSQTVTSVVIPQAITFTNTPPVNPQVNSTYTVTTNGGGTSGNSVGLSVDPVSTSGCTIATATGIVTLAPPAGTCVIDANQAGTTGAFSAAPQVQQSVTSNVIGQVINFTNTPPAGLVSGGTYTVVATGGASGNPVTFSVDASSTGGCTVNAATGVVALGSPAGTCVIDANQAGNAVYSAATMSKQSVTFSAITQGIAFTNIPPRPLYAGSTYTVTATGGGSGSPVILSVDPASTSGCTLSTSPLAMGARMIPRTASTTTSGTVTMGNTLGTCIIDANQAGGPAYSAAPQVSQTTTSVLQPQVIYFTNTPPTGAHVGDTYTVTATGGSSVSPVILSVDKSSTSGCTISNVLNHVKLAQGVAITERSVNATVTLSAPNGTCVIDANQAGTSTYSAAPQVSQSVSAAAVTVALIPQIINFTNQPPKNIYLGYSYLVTAKGGASGNAVTFSKNGSASTGGCTVSFEGLVTFKAPVGTCVVLANQDGNATYSAASTVVQISQSIKSPAVITFIQPVVNPPVNSVYHVGVKGSGSTAPVIFSKENGSTSGCVVAKNGVITFKAPAGSCIVRATQAGDAKFKPASYIARVFHSIVKKRQHQPAAYPASATTMIFYANDSWDLSLASQQTIAKFAQTIKTDHLHHVIINGYASLTGSVAGNDLLGAKRAGIAAAYLVKRLALIGYHGVIVKSTGNGASKFLVLPASAAKNRRTGFSATR